MKKVSWILILLVIVSFSKKREINHCEAIGTCNKKPVKNNVTTKQDGETMMMSPLSFNLDMSAIGSMN